MPQEAASEFGPPSTWLYCQKVLPVTTAWDSVAMSIQGSCVPGSAATPVSGIALRSVCIPISMHRSRTSAVQPIRIKMPPVCVCAATPNRTVTTRLSSAWFRSAWLGSTQLSSAWLGSAFSAPLSCMPALHQLRLNTCPTPCTPGMHLRPTATQKCAPSVASAVYLTPSAHHLGALPECVLHRLPTTTQMCAAHTSYYRLIVSYAHLLLPPSCELHTPPITASL